MCSLMLVFLVNVRYRWREWRERTTPVYVSRYEERF